MRGWIAFQIAALLLLAAPPLPAAPAPAVSAQVKLKVVRLARQGKHHFNAKRYREALTHWKKAYGLWPKPQLLFNIALAYDKLGSPAEAMTYLQAFEREAARVKIGARVMAAAARLRASLTPKVARLAVSGTAGARVFADGKLVGAIPLTAVLRPGVRSIDVRSAGYAPDRRRILLPAGTLTRLIVHLSTTAREAPPPRKRRVVVRPPPPRQRRAPPGPVTPPPPGGSPTPKRGLHMAYVLSVAGLALALAGAAIGTGLEAIRQYDRFQDEPTTANRDRVVRWRDATTGLWVTAGAAGAAAVVLAIFTRWRSRPERTRPPRRSWQLVPGPGSLGLGVRGGF